MQVNDERINRLCDMVSANPMVEKVILYGSRAKGNNSWYSDIDVAVSMPYGSLEDWGYIEDILEYPPTLLKIDMVNYDRVSDDLKKSINDEGLVLYERGKVN